MGSMHRASKLIQPQDSTLPLSLPFFYDAIYRIVTFPGCGWVSDLWFQIQKMLLFSQEGHQTCQF